MFFQKSIFFFFLTFLLLFSQPSLAKKIRVGVLQYGTVHWELDVIERYGLLKKNGIELEILPVSSSNAANVMLHSGRVDMVVGDWIWVSRQRHEGRNYTSFPYSLAEGSLMVNPESGIKSIGELQGLKVGIAGGEVNKNWLIMRAYSINRSGIDIKDLVEPAFAAPPLLNQLMLRGDFDAVLNFWHYNAQLESAGMVPLISVDEMLDELIVNQSLPLLVWIFREEWAKSKPDLIKDFLDASFTAKEILIDSDKEWQRIKEITRTSDVKTLQIMREAYKAGIPKYFDEQELEAASKIHDILASIAGKELVGENSKLSDGTFYAEYTIERD